MPGFTVDTGGLIAIERGNLRISRLLEEAVKADYRVTIPATVWAQAIRQPERQAELTRIAKLPETDFIPLNRDNANSVGRLLAASGTADVVDGHVAVCARQRGQPVITSDPDDIRLLDPTIEIVPVSETGR